MKSFLIKFAPAIMLSAVLTSPALAASVTYSFTGISVPDGFQTGSFVYTHPTFISGSFNTEPGDLTSCTVTTSPTFACYPMGFATGPFFDGAILADVVAFRWYDSVGEVGGNEEYFFPLGALGSVGSYSTLGGDSATFRATLVVSQPGGGGGGGGPTVPEPATWAMLIAGFGLVGGVLRRRRSLDALAA